MSADFLQDPTLPGHPDPYPIYAQMREQSVAHWCPGPQIWAVLSYPEAAEALRDQRLVREAVRMLCAGIVHGDLSEFNVLLAEDGPVIIDLPQAVDAAGNNHACRMLLRDVANLRAFFGGFDPSLRATEHGPEIWDLYRRGALHPGVVLTGRFEREDMPVDLEAVIREIDDAQAEERARLLRMQAAD